MYLVSAYFISILHVGVHFFCHFCSFRCHFSIITSDKCFFLFSLSVLLYFPGFTYLTTSANKSNKYYSSVDSVKFNVYGWIWCFMFRFRLLFHLSMQMKREWRQNAKARKFKANIAIWICIYAKQENKFVGLHRIWIITIKFLST